MLAPFNFRDSRCSERWEPGALRALRAAPRISQKQSPRRPPKGGHTNPELARAKKSPTITYIWHKLKGESEQETFIV